MTAKEIKWAVDNGLTVHWSHEGYEVIKDKNNEYLIRLASNKHCIGLTWQDNTTLNGKEEDFFIKWPNTHKGIGFFVGIQSEVKNSNGYPFYITLICDEPFYLEYGYYANIDTAKKAAIDTIENNFL